MSQKLLKETFEFYHMKKILFVDDEPNVLSAFQRQLQNQFLIETALGPEAGLAALKDWQNYSVVVADMRMPGMDGVEFLSRIKDAAPDVVRIMLTGNADQATAIEAINQGSIFRFLNKPCSQEKLTQALKAALRQHQLITAEREILENTLCGSIKVLTDILAIIDPPSFSHAERLRDNARQVAIAMKITETWTLETAAMLVNIGRVTIPPEVALKVRSGHPLSSMEQIMYDRIPEVGAGLLSQIPRMEEISSIIRYQKKQFNGEGHPGDQVKGNQIPFGARLLKLLCDLIELEDKGVTRGAALERVRFREGWYDPKILNAVITLFRPALEYPTLEIKFAQLRVGHVLRSDVRTKDGTLIVVAGIQITQALLERLRNFDEVSGIKEPISIENSGTS